MSKTNNLTDFLKDVANAIREKKNTVVTINPQNFASEIKSISSGGEITVYKTVYVRTFNEVY